MAFFATAGSKIYIGGPLSMKEEDFVVADFASQAWTPIGGATNLGRMGDTATPISSSQIGSGRDKVLKGNRSAGTMDVVYDANYDDEGQLALIAAEREIHDYAFKIEFNDAPPGASAKPSTRYFIGKVMSAAEALEEANSVVKLNASIAINSNIVRVPASAS